MTTGRATRQAKETTAMPAILSNTPPGFDWGWHSREDQRMHLQVVDPRTPKERYKIWLEAHGRRVIEPVGPIRSGVFKVITTAITKHRQFIEDNWVRFMIRNGWLEAHLAPPKVTLAGYPRTPNAFTRIVDLTVDLLEEEAMSLVDRDVTLSPKMASLQVWPWKSPAEWTDLRLSTILWEG